MPASEPVGPRYLAPIAPNTPVAPRVTPKVAADFPASSKKFLPLETSWATCAASIPPSASAPRVLVRVNARAVISAKGFLALNTFAGMGFGAITGYKTSQLLS